MQNWYNIFPKNTGLSIYVWIIFCLLPFYFIFRLSSAVEIIIGILLILLFFGSYRLSFVSKGRLVYFCVAIEMIINLIMTMFYGYVYFAIFLAFFIGSIPTKVGFFTMYVIHLVTTIIAVVISSFTQTDLFFSQLPFIILSLIGVILMPFNTYNRIKQEKLENQLEDANKRIAQLMVIEERQRIARDLHDTLGQKLSLIGLKSDLAGKLIEKNQLKAKVEIQDIHQTARTALKEVRDMVSDMRAVTIEEELLHVHQLLKAAEITMKIDGEVALKDTPLLVENMISMCLKEAVTNVVKHSKATRCKITIKETPEELQMKVEDNGVGIPEDRPLTRGNGLRGIKERLEFVNGTMELITTSGTTLDIRVPNIIKRTKEGKD